MAANELNRRVFLGAVAGAGVAVAARAAGTSKPFRVGIVGSENSHSEAFATLINKNEAGKTYGEVRVTHLWGETPERTKEVAEKCGIATIVERPEAMIGAVDGVICVRRHGGKHLEDALPFLKAKVPAFVDKPLTCSISDAKQLIAAAQDASVGFSSFSALRYAPAAVEFAARVRDEGGEAKGGTSTCPCEIESQYGGIFFYGIHAVELMTAVWGYGVKEVQATRHGGGVSAVCTYQNGMAVTVQLLDKAASVFHLAAFGSKAWATTDVKSDGSYAAAMDYILATLVEQAWPIDATHLIEPVAILSAIELSFRENRRVSLAELL